VRRVAKQARGAKDSHRHDELLHRGAGGFGHGDVAELKGLDALSFVAEPLAGEDLDVRPAGGFLADPAGYEDHRLVDGVAGVDAVTEFESDSGRPRCSGDDCQTQPDNAAGCAVCEFLIPVSPQLVRRPAGSGRPGLGNPAASFRTSGQGRRILAGTARSPGLVWVRIGSQTSPLCIKPVPRCRFPVGHNDEAPGRTLSAESSDRGRESAKRCRRSGD